jgi:hypothetical protein
MVKCNGLDKKLCKLPDCMWINKKRKFCRTAKKKTNNKLSSKRKKKSNQDIIIHYIYLDIGLKPFKEQKDYLENIKHNCKLYPNYKIWFDNDIKELIDKKYPELKERINKLPYHYLIDLGRSLILNLYDGFYCDMDIKIMKKLPEREFYHALYTYPKSQKTILGNSLFKLPKDLYYPFIIYSLDEFDRLSKKKIYKVWKYRKLLHSVGGYALKRFCKQHNIELDFPFYEYCREYNTASVLQIASNKKGYGAGHNYND